MDKNRRKRRFLSKPQAWYVITELRKVYGITLLRLYFLRLDYIHTFGVITYRNFVADYIHAFGVIKVTFRLAKSYLYKIPSVF